ncbi:tRNA A64-2'-O-ribosylphosphate transferase [Coemansia brasiliensis]|uniref:tRNA A64-2'-O-ribosylphosphate transferase n=1 Tax=Coemansia brasiliensis TaxID=2650707 RepID=A0A9W8IBY6_9FUNG|nr:tRNA A64-2'-O-ribosylphosphate transferase [Coemansia brasiliensis]
MESSDIYELAKGLRKDSRSMYNRLRSIDEDSQFVTRVSQMLPAYPVVANERCGVWYVDPQLSAQTAYFKSTDGHANNWKFSLRRANTHIFPLLTSHSGVILVDSTRKGKSMPDSFSRTIPIWCAVWNNAMAINRGMEWDSQVHTPPSIVSLSENEQMCKLIPQFTQQLLLSDIDVGALTGQMKKPLRPVWITRDHRLAIPPDFTDASFYPIICVSASSTEESGNGFMYVQGAADDHELWAEHLTPQLFWQHREQLLASKSDCMSVMQHISSEISSGSAVKQYSFIRDTNVAIGTCEKGQELQNWLNFDVVINCSTSNVDVKPSYLKRYLHLPITDSKRGQLEMAQAIPRAIEFIAQYIGNRSTRILVHCAQGTNVSVCIALAILTKYFDSQGMFNVNSRKDITKQMIQNRLLWITTAHAKATESSNSTFEQALGMMQSEWRRVEVERMEWQVERIRLKAKISASEKRISQLSALYTVSQRQISMLESMIKQHSEGAEAENCKEIDEDVDVQGIVKVTKGTRERSRKLLERCLGEIEALANGQKVEEVINSTAASLNVQGQNELGHNRSSASLSVAIKPMERPKLNGIIESHDEAVAAADNESSLSLASTQLPAVTGDTESDDEGSQPEQRPIRKISERRRRTAAPAALQSASTEASSALTVDEVDMAGGKEWHEQRRLIGHMDGIRALCTQPNGKAVSGGDDGMVILWDVKQRGRQKSRQQQPVSAAGDITPAGIFRGHLAAVTSVVLDSEHIYSCALDSTIKMWKLPHEGLSGEEEVENAFPAGEFLGHTDAVWGLALAPSGTSLLASVSADATCRLWSTEERFSASPLRATLTYPQKTSVPFPTAINFVNDANSDDGARLAIGYDSGLVDVRDLVTKNSVHTVNVGSRITRICSSGTVLAVASLNGNVHLCDLRTSSKNVKANVIAAYPQPGVAAIAVDKHAEERMVATGGSNGVVKWWDWRKPQSCLCEITAHQQKADEGVGAVAFIAADCVLTGGADGVLKMFNT